MYPVETGNDILDIVGDDVLNGGNIEPNNKIIENILSDSQTQNETDERNPITDILERNPVDDILEHQPVVSPDERNPVDDILEKQQLPDPDERNPVDDILEQISEECQQTSTPEIEPIVDATNAHVCTKCNQNPCSCASDDIEEEEIDDDYLLRNNQKISIIDSDDEFYSDYSDDDDVQMKSVKRSQYLELLNAIRNTNRSLLMQGGSKQSEKPKNVKIIDAFPWIVDDSSDECN
jgi:hypothetical protein